MKKNTIRAFIIVLLIILMLPSTVHAIGVYYETYGESVIYMHDLADLLTDSEEKKLMNEIGNRCNGIHYNILFLTTNSSDGKSTMTYSDDYMDELFLIDENNIAFVIDMENREIYINTMGNAILCLTDNMIDQALDRGYNYIANYEYAECMEAMATYCVARLSDNPGAGAVDTPISNLGFLGALGTGMIRGLLPAIIITAIILFVLVTKHNKANKAQSATSYVSNENYNVIDKDEIFVKSYETVQRDYYKPKSSSSGGGGGGSSHRSSGDRSHGGGGRSF
jgi:uncharacterized protein